MLHHGRHRVGLHRIVQLDFRRQAAPQPRHALSQAGTVVGIERRLADAFGQTAQRHAADLQAVVDDGEPAQRGMLRAGRIHDEDSLNTCASCVLSNLRSILPFGLRGRLSGDMMIFCGSI